MISKNKLQRSEEFIIFEEDVVRYVREFPFWIRLFLLPWSLFCIPFVLYYLGLAQSTDWTNTPIFGVIFATFGFLILPLVFSTVILWFAILGDSIDLTLNSISREIILQRKSPFRSRLTHYPLSNLQVYNVELESDYPVYDAAIVTLRMPDGVKVSISAFSRDEEAKYYIQRVRKLIAIASESP